LVIARQPNACDLPAGLDPYTGWGHVLKWAIFFFVVSVVAGLVGFTNVAAGARTIAKVLFFIALTLFVIVLVFGVLLGVLVF
jgi:uncharacterized membrane protein YtjA (UPF0391 family)